MSDPRGIPLTHEMVPLRSKGKRPQVSLLASRQGSTRKIIKNKSKHTSVSTKIENPMDCDNFFDTLSPLPIGTKISKNSTHVEETNYTNNSTTDKLYDIENMDTNPNTKRKLSNDDIITSAKKLDKISVQTAKNNLSDKIIITKYMMDNINKYNSLVEANIGKHNKFSFRSISRFGKPNKNLAFTVEKSFEHTLCLLFKSGYLDLTSVNNLCQSHILCKHFYFSMHKCIKINFSSLREPDTDWYAQKEIPFQKHMKLLACAFYLNFNIPLMLRYLGSQYTGDDRNVQKILKNIYGKIPNELYLDIKRILTVGVPRFLTGEMSRKNFLEYWRYGNHSTMDIEKHELNKVLNKEDKHKYMFSLPIWTVRFIPNLHLSHQGLIQKKGKED